MFAPFSPSSGKHKHELTELERQLEYTAAMFMSLGDGAIATNEEGRVTRVNGEALRILGCNERQIVGEWFQKVLIAVDQHGDPIDAMDRPVTKALLSGKPVSARMFYKSRKGKAVPVYVTVAPIVTHGKPIGTIEIFRDITNEYEIDSLKSEFISLASHQLRTPLTAISTYTHMLLQGFRGEVEEPQKEFLHTILASADRMNQLIDTLLDVQRLESGKVKVNLSNVNITELLRSTKQELWPLAKTKSQFLITKEPAEDVYARTDALMLTEVCTNLISNAIKYTPVAGEIIVSLEDKGTEVIIEVKDTGHGIPKELHPRVFTKFFRAPNILKEETVGTGLGLYMVKEITQNLGGTISFVSHENKGSTFTVTLPKDGTHHANETVRII